MINIRAHSRGLAKQAVQLHEAVEGVLGELQRRLVPYSRGLKRFRV